MLKHTIGLIAALLLVPAAHAQSATQPLLTVEGFYGNMRATLGGTSEGDDGSLLVLRTLRGGGYGGRVTVAPTSTFEVYGEYGTHDLDIEDDFANLEVDFDQVRGGFRAVARPDNFDYPLYAAAGLEYAHIKSKGRIQFGSDVTEEEAGEDPAADADNRPNDVSLGDDKDNFGIGHVRAGYRSDKTHLYGDLGYGMSDDDTVFEMTAGVAYRFAPFASIFGEYRSSLFSGDDSNKNRFNDLRLGVGFSF